MRLICNSSDFKIRFGFVAEFKKLLDLSDTNVCIKKILLCQLDCGNISGKFVSTLFLAFYNRVKLF